MYFTEIWLKWWGDSNTRNPGRENGKYLGVYAVLQVLSLAALAFDLRYVAFFMQFRIMEAPIKF